METIKQDDHDTNGIRLGSWEVGICGCFTHLIPNCCMAWCLPCVSVAQISSRLGIYKFSHVLLAFLFVYSVTIAMAGLVVMLIADVYEDTVNDQLKNPHRSDDEIVDDLMENDKVQAAAGLFWAARIIMTVSGLVYVFFLYKIRSQVRARFQIGGNCCEDVCCAWFCSCCTIAQMATHVKSYKPGSCDFGPPDTLPAYK